MPQVPTFRHTPLLRALRRFLGTLALLGALDLMGMLWPQHAAAARVELGVSPGALWHASAATAPETTVSSTPLESQHPSTPVEAPDSGIGSIEAGDDLRDFDDFAYQLRVVFDGSAQMNREVERRASLGGRAFSRLEDNRSDKPPRG
jgi:hypothetical protein